MKLLHGIRQKIFLLAGILSLQAPGSSQAQQVTGSEYFFDTDPGPGNGTSLNIGTAGDSVDFDATITITGLNVGNHMLYVRTVDGNGKWSLHKPERFFIKSQLTAAEYFIDTDPGVGNGVPIAISTSFDSVSYSASVSTTGLVPGPHTVYTRTRDNAGQWSLQAPQRFFIKKDITAAEYFFDTDPGTGNGIPLSLSPALDSTGLSGSISTAGLQPGYHFLCVRTKSGEGKWSLYDWKRIYIKNSIVAAEYFFDLDPGPGNAYAYTVAAPSDSVNIQDGLLLPSLTPGWHYLYFRLKDATGRWSLSYQDSVDVLPFTCIPPSLSLAGTNLSCFSSSDGAVTLGTTGGSAPFSYQWTGPGGFVSIQQNISGLTAGEYHIQVTGYGGCYTNDSILVTQPAQLSVSASNNSPFCSGNDLELSVNSNYDTSGTTTYAWTGPNGFTSAQKQPVLTGATNAHNGEYKVVISTGAGCTDSASTMVAIVPIVTYYADADGDGYGNAAVSVSTCTGPPAGYVNNNTDCNDTSNTIHPGAPEICNGIDDDCDGSIDEAIVFTSYYADADHDGFGNPAVSQTICTPAPAGYVTDHTDCNDADSLEHPGQVWYTDQDGDGYGTGVPLTQCTRPANGHLAGELTATGGDCNDNNAGINPAAQSLSFSGSTNFTNGVAFPLLGSSYTLFQFEASYTDVNNNLPPAFYPRVLLDYEGNGVYNNANDRTVVMTEADVNDTTTSDGKKYIGSVNSLPTGTSWETRVVISTNGCNTEIGPFSYPDVLVQPDLEIFANDVSFSSQNPAISSSLTVNAVVHNPSDYFAQNFYVHLVNQYDTTIVYPDILVSSLAPHGATTVSWNITTPAVPAWCPMQVSIDYSDIIAETNELNNSAIRPFINGNYNLPGAIIAEGHTSPSTAYTTASHIGLYGSAHYTGTAVPLADSSVAGATVTFTIVETGAGYTTNTNSGGGFGFAFPSPGVQGTYHIQGSITDFTLTGNFTAEFTLVLPPPPPVPCQFPDLVAGINVSGNPGQVVAGTPLSGSFTVTNLGATASVGTVLSVSQSGGVPVLNNVTVPALAPGASFSSGFSNLVFNNPGSYSLCIEADQTQLQQECNESNNTGCRLFTVIPALPDIYPYSGTSGSLYICNAGAPTFTLYNSGGSGTGPFDCAVIVRLAGNIIDTLHHTVSNLPAQQFGTFSTPYTYAAPGNYAFELQCDVPYPGGVVTETEEGNNTASFYVTVLDCKPNLTMIGCESFDVQPVNPPASGTITLTATVFNNGNAPAPAPITVRFHLSGGADYVAVYNTSLPPNQSFTISTTAAAVAPATQTLTATADPDNTIAEFNESDNAIVDNMCSDFAPVPKCVLESNFWMHSYHVNQVVPLNIGVSAGHLYDASSVKVRFLVSGPGISGTVNLGDAVVTNLEQTCGCPATAVLPNSFVFPQIGVYTFTMISDPDNEYTECDESNNVLVRQVTVTNLPDMRVLSQHIAPSKLNPEPNEPITMNISYENIGQSNINDQMELRVLVDNTVVGSVYPVTGLVTGGTTTYTIPGSWSSGLTGIHVIRAIIDANGQVAEGNENNNEATRSVIVGQSSNLYFQLFAAANPAPALNENTFIHARIGNGGDVDVEGDVQFSYVNNALDTIAIGTMHVAVTNNDSVDIQIPWTVTDPSTVLIGKIVNASSLEFTYDDNQASEVIGAAPDLAFTSQPDCFGDGNGTLTAAVSGGEAPYTFSWRNGSSTQTITGTAGTYTLIVTDNFGRKDTAAGIITSGPCCLPCTKAPKKPGLEISPNSSHGGLAKFCPGDTVVVVVKTHYPTTCSYTWTPPAGTTILSGQGSPSVSLVLNGGYEASDFITVMAHNSCGSSDTGSKKISRGPKPEKPSVITGDVDAICGLNGVPYSVINVPAITYAWYFDSLNTAANTGVIAAGQGSHAISVNFSPSWVSGALFVTAANACGISNPRKLISIRSIPATPDTVTGPASVCPNQAGVAYATAALANTASYTWSAPKGSTISDGVTTSTANTLTTTAHAVTVNFGTKPGTVKVYATNPCGASGARSVAVSLGCGLKPAEGTASISLFPNPATDKLTVVFSALKEGEYTLRVFDALGKELLQRKGTASEGSNETELQVSTLAPGIYELLIQNESMSYKERFVVE